MKKIYIKYILFTFPFVLSTIAQAESNKPDITTQPFSVSLQTSRIIYNPAENGASLTVVNPQPYPVLIQSIVLREDMKSKASFIVTPPLIRLDAGQQSRLRVISTTANFPGDRETLNWLCVKGIPPGKEDLWAGDIPQSKSETSVNVRLSVNNCIKLFVRPKALGEPGNAASSLTWRYQGNKLIAVNTSPFYMNIVELKTGKINIAELSYIAPFGVHSFAVPNSVNSREIQWRVINDYGGKSPLYSAVIQ